MRIWVKRGVNGTPASIQLDNEDLVDDVKDAVFRKYPVALARVYDSPDVSICLVAPSLTKTNVFETKILAVDDRISNVIQREFPDGQRVEDAFLIQVPNTQIRNSPFTGPIRNSNSPLSGTLGLLTQDMRDFEYFPETPPVETFHLSQATDYAQNNKNFVPSNYSSASHTSGTVQMQNNAVLPLEGSFRPAPNISMNSARYGSGRERVRPGMGARTATTSSSKNSVGTYNRSDGAITFYPKQTRNNRAVSTSSSQYNSQLQGQRVEAGDVSPAMPNHVLGIAMGEDRAPSPSTVPLSEHELSAAVPPRSLGPINTKVASADMTESSPSPISPQNTRARRDTSAQSPQHAQRPSLARKMTASKLSLVSPAVSPHSSSGSVAKLDKTKVVQQFVKKEEAPTTQQSTFGVGGLLEGVVPPIVVLIVEDNMINQRILETFMKKRKIRCLTAKNGREAVDKWKQGGVHLVLMDIQMPVMSGIEAAKEIRRLERANTIGVFSKKDPPPEPVSAVDQLSESHFKSPVIIVALTASSLQSDRHEALAAGCNDFLTKPVSLVWLEKKVLEWGCMQALIDFEGWKKFRGMKGKTTVTSSPLP